MDLTWEERRAAIRSEWAQWNPGTLADHFDRCAARWPDRPFVISEHGSATYQELIDLSWRHAAALARAGVESGHRVGVMMSGGPGFIAVKVAAARLGALVVPLNYLLRPGELRAVLDSAELQVLIVHARIADVDVVGRLTEAGVRGSTGPTRLIVDGEWQDASDGVEDLESYLRVPALDRDSLPTQGPGALAEILFTSGSTGIAKGALLRHQALLCESFGTALTRGLTSGWRTMTALPTFHLFGYAQAVLPVTFVGGCVVVREKFDPVYELKQIDELGVNDVVCVPSMLHSLVDVAAQTEPRLDSLVGVFAAGDPVAEDLWVRARRVLGIAEITNGYGMTELSGTSFMLPPDASDEQLAHTVGLVKRAGHVGLPGHGGAQHEIRIVNPVSSEPVPAGEAGELQYRGPNLFAGYWENPEETARVFTHDGWFRSGDMGRLRPDGALVLTGRIKELFRTGGELVSPSEVEAVLAEVDSVGTAYVVGVPDSIWGEVGWAFLVPATGEEIIVEAVIQHCRERLAKYKVPREVRVLARSDLPTTSSGKIQKADLVTRAQREARNSRGDT